MALTPPAKGREGWTLEFGRFLFYINWSRSWDGWGTLYGPADKGGARLEWWPLAIIPFKLDSGSWGVRLYLWKLAMYFGMIPEPEEPKNHPPRPKYSSQDFCDPEDKPNDGP